MSERFSIRHAIGCLVYPTILVAMLWFLLFGSNDDSWQVTVGALVFFCLFWAFIWFIWWLIKRIWINQNKDEAGK